MTANTAGRLTITTRHKAAVPSLIAAVPDGAIGLRVVLIVAFLVPRRCAGGYPRPSARAADQVSERCNRAAMVGVNVCSGATGAR